MNLKNCGSASQPSLSSPVETSRSVPVTVELLEDLFGPGGLVPGVRLSLSRPCKTQTFPRESRDDTNQQEKLKAVQSVDAVV